MAPGETLSAPNEPPESGAAPSYPPGRPGGVAPEGGEPVESGAPAPPPADSPAEATARRATFALLGGAALVGVLCLLDWLPALYAVVVLAHVLVGLRWRRRGASAPLDEVRVAPTPVGVLVLGLLWVLLLFAVFLPSASFRLLACLLFACACAAWPIAARNVARARVSRRLAPRARVGVPTELALLVRNPTRRAAESLRVEDDLGLVARPAAIEASFETLRSGAEAVARVSVTFLRRGRRRLRPVRVSSAHPLGIFAATRDTAAGVEVLVRPRELAPKAALLERLRGRASEPIRARAVHAGADEFHGLREWRDGDDPRRVHPRTSARRGAPTFVERREEPARRVIVALAACAVRDRATDVAFERAVAAAAGLLRAAVNVGCATTLVLSAGGAADASEAPGVVPVRGAGGLWRALDALALVKADGGRTPRRAFAEGAVRTAGAVVVWISATPEGARDVPGAPDGVDPRRRLRLRADDRSFARFVAEEPS